MGKKNRVNIQKRTAYAVKRTLEQIDDPGRALADQQNFGWAMLQMGDDQTQGLINAIGNLENEIHKMPFLPDPAPTPWAFQQVLDLLADMKRIIQQEWDDKKKTEHD